ncbi:MAG: type II toxin-antitoxin system HipA family toxin [Candidatus Mucispirillum faecigallinarum]|nr:type II toxin-antitoxin system HipA family toxin [Candidatus Mucispirillum faecigallinarum]
MKNSKFINVYYTNIHAGILAQSQNGLIAFEYSDEFIQSGFSISPLSLPLMKKVYLPEDYFTFQGLFGVFNDSLPDGWGRLIVDRYLSSRGINIQEVSLLDRLAIISDYGMGALEYRPEYEVIEFDNSSYDLDKLSMDCANLFEDKPVDNIDELFNMAGSSGGARPKVLVSYNNEQWIIKFACRNDMAESGIMEYDYNAAAKECGIEVPEHKLFGSKICQGYFGVKRFDRLNGNKIHMVSACGLLETSHRIPNLDYTTLMKLTFKITNSMEEVKKMYMLMVFNVLAHNRDDHGKNFSYIYDENEKRYKLSPAYDLTYSFSINNEHATTVNGKGKDISIDDMLDAAKKSDVDIKFARNTIKDIQEKTSALKKYERY